MQKVFITSDRKDFCTKEVLKWMKPLFYSDSGKVHNVVCAIIHLYTWTIQFWRKEDESLVLLASKMNVKITKIILMIPTKPQNLYTVKFLFRKEAQFSLAALHVKYYHMQM